MLPSLWQVLFILCNPPNILSLIHYYDIFFGTQPPKIPSNSARVKLTTQNFEEMVGFVLEILRRDESSHSRFSKRITPARVRQMLVTYDNDVNLVLDFFLKEIESEFASNQLPPKLKAAVSSSSS